MTIKHQRITGVTTPNATHVNGKNWDDPHHYAPGSVFPIGTFRLGFDGSSFTHSESIGVSYYKNNPGEFWLSADITALPCAAVDPVVHSYMVIVNSLPGNGITVYTMMSWGSETARATIMLYDGTTYLDPAVAWEVSGVIFCAVAP